MNRNELWQRLAAAGLVSGECPEPLAFATPTPWYIRVMQGLAGWLGALFLLGFFAVGFASLMRNEAALTGVGVLCCAAAYAVTKTVRDNEFGTQFALAVSLCGQLMVIFGLFQWFGDYSFDTRLFLVIAIFEAALWLLVPGFLHRLLTSWAAVIALCLALYNAEIFGLSSALGVAGFVWVWWYEPRWGDYAAWWRPLGYALAFSVVQINSYLAVGGQLFGLSDPVSWEWLWALIPWLRAVMIGAVALLLTVGLLRRERVTPSAPASLAALAGAALIGVLAYPMPGAAGGALILVVGFANGNRLLLGLGLFALLGFVSHYYYSLQLTLLTKSLLLMGLGGVLLVVRWPLRYLLKNPKQSVQ